MAISVMVNQEFTVHTDKRSLIPNSTQSGNKLSEEDFATDKNYSRNARRQTGPEIIVPVRTV